MSLAESVTVRTEPKVIARVSGIERRIASVQATPPAARGFAGAGHEVVEVLRPDALAHSDPFVLLMDDRLDFEDGRSIGGEHPHAGLETVTLLLEGSLRDRDEGTLNEGDAVWMTAGRGIIHNEHVEAAGRARILQLWIGLPKALREVAPSFERIPLASLPVRREPGVEARLYSGESGALRSTTRNLVNVTLLDVRLDAGAEFEQALPARYNGFVYVVGGAMRAGADGVSLKEGQVGWLDRVDVDAPSVASFIAERGGARFVLYAGEPHAEELLQHGPFVAGSEQEFVRFFQQYRAGRFERLSTLSPAARTSADNQQTRG
jgi:redox-sensitive bicupin YhaK (pirin superfamily)